MAVSLRRAGSGPDDPFRIVTSAGKVVADPDDPTKPLELAIKADDLKLPTAPESPEIKALREELAAERQVRQRETENRMKADQDVKIKAIIDGSAAFAGSLVTEGKITAASQKGISDAHAALSLTAAGLPIPDSLKASAALEGFKTAVAELPATGLNAPVIDPDGGLPADLQALPNGKQNGQVRSSVVEEALAATSAGQAGVKDYREKNRK